MPPGKRLHVSLTGKDNSLHCCCFRLGILQNILQNDKSHSIVGQVTLAQRCLKPSLWNGIRASNDLKHSQKLFSNSFYPSEFELQLVIPSDLCVSTPMTPMRVVLQLTHVILHGIQLVGQTLYARCWPNYRRRLGGGNPISWRCIIWIVVFLKSW